MHSLLGLFKPLPSTGCHQTRRSHPILPPKPIRVWNHPLPSSQPQLPLAFSCFLHPPPGLPGMRPGSHHHLVPWCPFIPAPWRRERELCLHGKSGSESHLCRLRPSDLQQVIWPFWTYFIICKTGIRPQHRDGFSNAWGWCIHAYHLVPPSLPSTSAICPFSTPKTSSRNLQEILPNPHFSTRCT